MDLLLKREQTQNWRGKIVFHLWAKAEVSADEKALLVRYRMNKACLIAADDTEHFRGAIMVGLVAFLVGGFIGAFGTDEILGGLFFGIIAGFGTGYWWLNEKRETIWMRDLLHSRRFKCASIIELAKKEAALENTCAALRQVIETAKHWDGVETRPVSVLPPDEAKEVVLRLS